MSLYPNLSKREKLLALGVVLLLAVFVTVGYTKALAEDSTAGVLVAQSASVTPAPVTPVVDEKSVNQDDTKNQQNRLRDQQNYLKNMQREIQDIKKQAKTLDSSAADALLAKFAACIQSRTAEVGTQDFWNNMQDCDSMTRDIEDQFNDNLRPQRDCADRQRNVNDRRRERKNLDSQVKDILRMNKNADISALKSVLAQIDALFTKADQAVATACSRDTADLLNDIQNEFNTLFQDFYNASNELRELASCPQTQKNINDRKKERKNLDSQIKDIRRQNKNADVSALTAILAQIDALFTKADQAAASTCSREIVDTLNDIQNEFNTLFQDFYNASNDVRQQADQGRQEEDQARQLTDSKRDFEKDKKARCEKDKKRELGNFEKELKRAGKQGALTEDAQAAYDNVKAIYDKMCVTDLAAMKAALDAGDFQTYNDVRGDFDGLDRDFWDSLNESRQGVQEKTQKVEQLKNVTRELKGWTSQLKNMKREVARLKKLYDRTAKKYADKAERKEALAAFKDYVAKAGELVGRIEEGINQAKAEAPDDPESWWMDHQQDLNDLRQDFNDMQQEIQMIGQILQTLAQAEKDIVKGTAKELTQLKRESNNDPELIGKLNDIVARAKASLTEAWGLAISSPEDAMTALQGLQDFQQEWQETVQDWRDSQAEQVQEEEQGW